MPNLAIAALGHKVTIGTFYDARTDNFLPECLFKSGLPAEAIQRTTRNNVSVIYNGGSTYQKQIESMGVGASQSASILAGMVNCRGSGRFLSAIQRPRSAQGALHHAIHTCTEKLNTHDPTLRGFLTTDTIRNSRVTHIVAEIEWGARSIVTARLPISSLPQTTADLQQFQADFADFASCAEMLQHNQSSTLIGPQQLHTRSQAEITFFSDMLEEDDGILLQDFQEAYEYLMMMPLHIKDEAGKGWPIQYSLLPVEVLSYVLPVQVLHAQTIVNPAIDCLDGFSRLFDGYNTCETILDDCLSMVMANKQFLPPDLQGTIRNRQQNLKIAVRRLKEDFALTLQAVRGGSRDSSALWNLLTYSSKEGLSPTELGDIGIAGIDTAEFVKTAVDKGATYVGYNGKDLDDELRSTPYKNAYIFFHKPGEMKTDPAWASNRDLLFEILESRDPGTLVVVVDCEATSDLPDKTTICHYQEEREISGDVLGDRVFMAERSFALCDPKTIETENIQPPIQRRHVTIPCPGNRCGVAKVREWLCPRCKVPVEYGFSDKYIYCECGRSLYSNYEFKCSNELHGREYFSYDPDHLLRLLNGLIQTNYLNILILGETGVGKSTFINAMVNYLEFETLDEAIETEKLNYVIPCSFSTQIMDRSNPNLPIQERRIQIGARDDEKDGSKGDSATQRTTVYPVTFQAGDSTLTVRLIDTPGIGDSRGVDYDRSNMADILATISGYDMIHGILILLKSNNARLTITFRYCIKELLSHLHHNASTNMAFGFTNTRISNYTPGDTYGPLKNLLDQHPDVGLKLVTPTTYCFDSESFRYLAAFKSNVTMPNKTDFDRSWTQSRDETIRLIDHFQSIPPHEVKNTMSLNGARQLISELTKPLADISQNINTNIQLVEDLVQTLKDTRLKGDKLRNSLHVQKIQMNSEPLDKPRTVCAHADCIELRDDGKDQNTCVIVYKSHCHPVCYLEDVKCDQMAYPGLIHCAAFSGSNNCTICGHHWQQHLHILYELIEETVTVIDNSIQKQLNSHADDITLKQTAIQQHEKRVEEYKQERHIIRETAAKFCVFLKNNSLVPYNDALIAYLDFLIKEEQAKVQAGGNNKRLLSLTEERHKHQETIEIMTKHMNSNTTWNDMNEGGVDRMVQRLYNLKHFGKDLQNLKQGITTAHEATYRERPYAVKRKSQPKKMIQIRTIQSRPAVVRTRSPIRSSHKVHSSHSSGQKAPERRMGVSVLKKVFSGY